ncbi:hypothetical protein P7K49_007224 [Saguinus oedipus]|uniref:Uncharacterized protein n=1 Tax=Saguinus oedipus TaxID=9490 RepID=A0ABQ9VWM3_SAGOE|nr:hypothetical protein P7K49_007224 [Saguinus oedipus]
MAVQLPVATLRPITEPTSVLSHAVPSPSAWTPPRRRRRVGRGRRTAATAAATRGPSSTDGLWKLKSPSQPLPSPRFIPAHPAPHCRLLPTAQEFTYQGGGSPSFFFDGANGQGSGTAAHFGGSGAVTGNRSGFYMVQVFGGGANRLLLEKPPFIGRPQLQPEHHGIS